MFDNKKNPIVIEINPAKAEVWPLVLLLVQNLRKLIKLYLNKQCILKKKLIIILLYPINLFTRPSLKFFILISYVN